MKKTNMLWMVLGLIFPVVFNLMFFLAGGADRRTSVWISYGCIHFAYLMVLLTPVLIRKDKSSVVFGFTLYATSICYFLVELAVGGLFILIPWFGTKTTVVIQSLMTGLYGVMLIAHLIANEKTADAQQARQVQIDYIKQASMRLKLLLDRIQDRDAQRKVERAYDALNSSPVKSYPDLERMEKDILSTIDAIDNAIAANNKATILSLADSLLRAITERNLRLRQYHP